MQRAVSDGKEIPDNPVAGRAIYQMDDEGNIIAEYISVSLASKTSGVNPKSIRDAAKGVQKHAGGFVWRYKDQIETD